MRRIIIALLMTTLAGSLTFGAAATLSVSADDLAAGSAPVQSCDLDGFNIEYRFAMTAPIELDEIVIDDIDNGCDGQRVDIELQDLTGVAIWSSQVYMPVDPSATWLSISLTGAGISGDVSAQVWITITGEVWL